MLKHIPIAPPRQGHDGEVSFLAAWQQFADRAPDDFEAIFSHRISHRFAQRSASVAASFVMWLGTNAGACLIRSGNDLATKGLSRTYAYVAAWAIDNQRIRWINSGLRSVQYVLAAEYPIEGAGHEVLWSKVPVVTLEDLDVIDALMEWLATSQGQTFLVAAQARLDAAHRERHLFQNIPLCQGTV